MNVNVFRLIEMNEYFRQFHYLQVTCCCDAEMKGRIDYRINGQVYQI